VTAQGHPRATFNRAIEHGNLLVAATILREIGRPSLTELLALTALIAEGLSESPLVQQWLTAH
jgi:hypothetical protein